MNPGATGRALGVEDRLALGLQSRADLHDPAVPHAHVGVDGGSARTVNNSSSAYQQIVHVGFLCRTAVQYRVS